GFAKAPERLFRYQSDKLPERQVHLGMDRGHGRETTEMHNVDGVVIGKAMAFGLEEEALDDADRCAVNAFPVEYDRLTQAQVETARSEAGPDGNVGQNCPSKAPRPRVIQAPHRRRSNGIPFRMPLRP